MKTPTVRGKECVLEFSHKPERVVELEHSGKAIMNVITARRLSPELRSWVSHFRSKDWPIFASQATRKGSEIDLWSERLVGEEAV